MHSDSLTKKGVLFARIKLAKGFLNVFTTHTQASYIYPKKEDELPSFVVRLNQLSVIKEFMELQLVQTNSPNDLSLLLGDLNVNANESNYPMEQVLGYFEGGAQIRENIVASPGNEYDLMMYLFNNPTSKLRVSDCMYERHKTFKVTYGDTLLDENRPLVE